LSQLRTPESGAIIQKAHPCEVCDPLLKDILHLAEHQGSHPLQKLYTRGPCGRGFWISANSYQHQKRYSGEDLFSGGARGASYMKSCAVHTLGRPFTCREEGMDLLDRSGLFFCQTTGNEMIPYERTEFMESFPHSASLGQHQGDHDGLVLFNCTDNGKGFLNTFTLLGNRINDTEVRPFRCPPCGSMSKERSAVTNHRKVHSGEISHVCKECGKAFSHGHQLTQHQKIHTGEKSFECKECGKACNHVNHQRVHTAEKPIEQKEGAEASIQHSFLPQHKENP